MATTIDDLADDVQAFFAGLFPTGETGGPGSMLLLFDNIGTPLDADEFATAPFGQQRVAQLADQLPNPSALASGWYTASSGTRLSRWYEAVVEASSPVSAAEPNFTAFAKLRQEAARSLEENKLILASAPGGADAVGTHDIYYATRMTPADWYAPDSTAWASYEMRAQDSPPPPPPATPLILPKWRLRVSDAEQALNVPAIDKFVGRANGLARIAKRHIVPQHPRTGLGRLVRTPEGDLIPEHLLEELLLPDPSATDQFAVGEQLPTGTTPAVPEPQTVEPEVIVQETSPVPVAADGFHVTFDYCLVRFERPWWNEVFLRNRGWSMPGHLPGDICKGTATDATGAISLMTVGMVVVRSLIMKASWTESDQEQLQRSISLGPFCVAGAVFDTSSGSLSRPGLQAIAWLCQVPPVLPPVTG
jgi:hypothetical protein